MSPNRGKKARRRNRYVLSRHNDRSSDQGRTFEGHRETEAPPRRARPSRNADEEALTLRDQGQTFAAVARSLGFKRAADARAAFLRALRQREGTDRDRLTDREFGRLDELEARIRFRDADHPEKMERRLVALEQMRLTLR